MSFAMITIMLIKTNHYPEVRPSLLNYAYFALLFEPLCKAFKPHWVIAVRSWLKESLCCILSSHKSAFEFWDSFQIIVSALSFVVQSLEAIGCCPLLRSGQIRLLGLWLSFLFSFLFHKTIMCYKLHINLFGGCDVCCCVYLSQPAWSLLDAHWNKISFALKAIS